MRILKLVNLVVSMVSCVLCFGQQSPYAGILKERFKEIKSGLDTVVFVKRFQSVETSCLCINEETNAFASPKRKSINSNYNVRLNDKKIDSGVKCLSQYYARYLKLTILNADSMSGIIESSYSYPASSIIQYLGFTYKYDDNTFIFFNKLIKVKGSFRLYPEDDKYRIQIVFHSKPFDQRDTIYGYLGMVKGVYSKDTAYTLYFDRMNNYRGDDNNQIFLDFFSSSHRLEMEYYSVLVYNVLKNKRSEILTEKANAIWLESFLNNPACISCKPIYNAAQTMIKNKVFSLPNTEPVPAH